MFKVIFYILTLFWGQFRGKKGQKEGKRGQKQGFSQRWVAQGSLFRFESVVINYYDEIYMFTNISADFCSLNPL